MSTKAEKEMNRGKIEPANVFAFKKLVNELVSKNKEIISTKAVELLNIDESKRIG